jgi:hypothetical protein
MDRFDCARSDVVAQALRAGCILFRRRLLPASDRNALEALADALLRFVAPDGAVFYARSQAPASAPPSASRHQNAWSAMFSYQAFVFYEQLGEAEPDVSLLS